MITSVTLRSILWFVCNPGPHSVHVRILIVLHIHQQLVWLVLLNLAIQLDI